MSKVTIKNCWNHFKKIIIHKHYVRKYCWMCGLYWQGLVHDLSKFSPTEFFESVKYYVGISSPIDEAKKANGYSLAWFHHRGRNKHHYEYWIDNLDNGGVPCRMPGIYAVEMLCDYLGAGHAYSKEKFTYKSELKYVINKFENLHAKIDPLTKTFILEAVFCLAELENDNKPKIVFKAFFENLIFEYIDYVHMSDYNKNYINDKYNTLIEDAKLLLEEKEEK